MKQFTDEEGRKWDIAVNVGTAKAVKDITGVNLFQLYNEEAERVFSDPFVFVSVLYVLCKAQAEKREVTEDQFFVALVGDALERASSALMEDVADFFPKGRRELFRRQMEKSKAMGAQIEAEAMAKLEALDVKSLLKSTASQAS